MSFGRILLVVAGGLTVAFGLAYLLSPGGMAGLAQIGTEAASARTDVRATYGGVQLGFGLYLLWASLSPARIPAALLAFGLLVGSVGGARLGGLLLDGGFNSFHAAGLAFELPGTLLAALAYRNARDATA